MKSRLGWVVSLFLVLCVAACEQAPFEEAMAPGPVLEGKKEKTMGIQERSGALLTGVLRGDVNADTEFTVSDVQCLVLTVIDLTPQLPETDPDCLVDEGLADINCDSQANVVDVQLNVGMVLGAMLDDSGIPGDKDSDGDNVHNSCDNCVDLSNSDQEDGDDDGQGDLCDPNPNLPGACPNLVPGEATACVEIDSSAQYPVAPHFNGLSMNIFNMGLQPWDSRIIEAARDLMPGGMRFPSGGTIYVYDWKGGQVPNNYIREFDPDKALECADDTECDGGRICTVFDGEETGLCRKTCVVDCAAAGFGPSCNLENCPSFKHECNTADPPGPGLGLCIGAKVPQFQSYRDTLQGKGYVKLYDFARFNDQIGALHVLDINVFTDNAASAGALTEDLINKGISIDLWFLGDEPMYWTNPVLQFFEDGADYAEKMFPYAQAIWQWLPDSTLAIGYSDMDNENHMIFDDDLANYSLENNYSSNKYWQVVNVHSFPGTKGQGITEGMLTANAYLHHDVPHIIDDHYLPHNGIPGKNNPVPSDLRLSFGYNIRLATDFFGSVYGMAFSTEYALRMSTHPRVRSLRFYSLLADCINIVDGKKNTMKKAKKQGWGAVDSQVMDYEIYTGLGCVAMKEVNRALNGSSWRWDTSLQGGLLVDYENETGETGQAPGLYGQTYRGNDGMTHLILTNRTASDHQITITMDGQIVDGPLDTWHVGNPEPGFKNVGSESDLGITEESMPNPVTVPAYGMMRVAWPLPATNTPLPANFNATVPAGVPHAVDLSWDSVPGATEYRVKYGVVEGHYPNIVALGASENSHRVEPLGHDIDLYFTVSAVVDESESENAPRMMATPTQHAPAQFADFSAADALDNWTVQTGGESSWNLDEGNDPGLEVSYSSGPTRIFTGGSSNTDFRVGVDFTVQNLEPDGSFGFLARYTDDNNHYSAYYDNLKGKFLITRTLEGVKTTLNRSVELGEDYMKSETEAWFPPVPVLAMNQPHRLRFDLDGYTLRLWLNGRLIASAMDNALSEGQVGLVSRRQVITFDNFEIREFKLYGP